MENACLIKHCRLAGGDTGELPYVFFPPSFSHRFGIWVCGHNEEPSNGRGIPSLPLAPLPGGCWGSPAAGWCAVVGLPVTANTDLLPLLLALGAKLIGAMSLLSICYILSATPVHLAWNSAWRGGLKRADHTAPEGWLTVTRLCCNSKITIRKWSLRGLQNSLP